jgi:glycosyltransferase involved in cell wall biosynthesis
MPHLVAPRVKLVVPPPAGREVRPLVRIAYCIDTMQVGGTEMNAIRTAERLDRSQFELVVASLQHEGPLLERYRAAGIRVVHFPMTSLYGLSALHQGLRMFRFLRRERIDILHCHDLYANLFGAPWGRIAGVPVVITSRRWLHPARNRKLEVANRMVYKVAHRVLANSHAVQRSLEVVDGVPAGRILHVPNFVDEAAFQALSPVALTTVRAELGVPADALVVGCIARLAPVKDHASLLRAVGMLSRRWPQLHLVLIGDGECRAALEALATKLEIRERVHFAGTRPNDPNLHQAFDISALTSLSEGFPNSIVEAMAAGRAVVATRVGGIVDAVRPGTGLLVPPGEPKQVAEALESLLANPSLRMSMGESASRVARAEYHARSVIPRLASIYLNLLGRPA